MESTRYSPLHLTEKQRSRTSQQSTLATDTVSWVQNERQQKFVFKNNAALWFVVVIEDKLSSSWMSTNINIGLLNNTPAVKNDAFVSTGCDVTRKHKRNLTLVLLLFPVYLFKSIPWCCNLSNRSTSFNCTRWTYPYLNLNYLLFSSLFTININIFGFALTRTR